MAEKQKISGLVPLTYDSRDLHLGRIVKLPELNELPNIFSLGETIIRNQEKAGNDDFCTAYSTVGMSYLEDGVEGSPEWVFAASKEISGDNEAFGQDMRTAFKTWVKYGSPRKEDVNPPQNPQDRRYLKNYDSSLNGAELKKKTYVTCKGQYDAFDNIRASIWKFKEQKRAVGIGLVFAWPLSSKYLDKYSTRGFGHMMFATGWKDDYLETPNSYGREAGDNGKHYVSRETINYFVEKYGAYILIDLDKKTARSNQRKYQIRKFFKSLFCLPYD